MTKARKQFDQFTQLFKTVDESPAAVVFVTIHGMIDSPISSVFSTYGKAEDWINERATGEYWAISRSYIIDEPSWKEGQEQ